MVSKLREVEELEERRGGVVAEGRRKGKGDFRKLGNPRSALSPLQSASLVLDQSARRFYIFFLDLIRAQNLLPRDSTLLSSFSEFFRSSPNLRRVDVNLSSLNLLSTDLLMKHGFHNSRAKRSSARAHFHARQK